MSAEWGVKQKRTKTKTNSDKMIAICNSDTPCNNSLSFVLYLYLGHWYHLSVQSEAPQRQHRIVTETEITWFQHKEDRRPEQAVHHSFNSPGSLDWLDRRVDTDLVALNQNSFQTAVTRNRTCAAGLHDSSSGRKLVCWCVFKLSNEFVLSVQKKKALFTGTNQQR